MGWWQKLFGRRRESLANGPLTFSVVPGLSVRVHSTTIPNGEINIPCWTYLSQGLTDLGQKEILFSLQRSVSEHPDDFPKDPFSYFAYINEEARQGRTVDVGNFTKLHNPSGFLGFSEPIGFAYVQPVHFADFQISDPQATIASVLLTPAEAEVSARIGTYRITAMLGFKERYYPCPLWSDRHRPTIHSIEQLLQFSYSDTQYAYFPGATASVLRSQPLPWHYDLQFSLTGEDFCLRVPREHQARLWKELSRNATGNSFVVLTDPDPEANARLVWHPEPHRRQTIQPKGSDTTCITGGHLEFMYGCPWADGGTIDKDGFTVWASPESWQRILEAVRTGTSVRIPSVIPDRSGFSLEWTTPYAKPKKVAASSQTTAPAIGPVGWNSGRMGHGAERMACSVWARRQRH